MKEKLYAIQCLNPDCGKILTFLVKLSKNAFGIDEDANNRFHTDEKGSYIICKFCGKKNAFVNSKEDGLPILRLSYIRD